MTIVLVSVLMGRDSTTGIHTTASAFRTEAVLDRRQASGIGSATYTITAEVWVHEGPAAWHFVTLPGEVADELELRFAEAHRPFGSLAVRVTLGGTTWTTSLFRDTKSASYLLPIKAGVRRRERVADGDTATVELVVEG